MMIFYSHLILPFCWAYFVLYLISLVFAYDNIYPAFHGSIKILKDDFENEERNMSTDASDPGHLLSLAQLVWVEPSLFDPPHHLVKIKCLFIQILSKIRANHFIMERYLEILDFALHDESHEVEAEAVISMPVIVFFSGGHVLEYCYRRLK